MSHKSMLDMLHVKKANTMTGITQILILLMVLAVPASGLELHFKISGGYASLKPDGINRSIEDWAKWRKIEAEENKNWVYLGENIGKMHSGINLEGEILLFLSSRFGVGLGAGYIYSDLNEEETEVTVQRPGGTLSQVLPVTVSVYPITLSAYYLIPLKKKLSLFFRGGYGLAWAKYVNREGKKFITVKNYNYFEIQKASATGSVILGGFGLVYETDAGVRFFIEGLTRLVKIQGFSGENELGTTGTLFYLEEYNPDLDFWQAKNKIMAEEPSGPNFRSVAEAVVDFSGFSAKIGFMIRF